MSVRTIRALLAVAGVLAVLLAILAGASDAALHASPLLVVATLLISGCFVGESRILALRRSRSGHKLRGALALRWTARVPVLAGSLLERSPRTLRGPPASA